LTTQRRKGTIEHPLYEELFVETTESVVLAIVVWGIAALLLSYIAVLKIKKKISWKMASIAVIVVFTLRGTLITLLAGVFVYNIYSEYGKPIVAYLEYCDV
jgi:hypothetical protein